MISDNVTATSNLDKANLLNASNFNSSHNQHSMIYLLSVLLSFFALKMKSMPYYNYCDDFNNLDIIAAIEWYIPRRYDSASHKLQFSTPQHTEIICDCCYSRKWASNCHAMYCILSVCDCCGCTIPNWASTAMPSLPCAAFRAFVTVIPGTWTPTSMPRAGLWLLWLHYSGEMDIHCLATRCISVVSVIEYTDNALHDTHQIWPLWSNNPLHSNVYMLGWSFVTSWIRARCML